MAGTVSAWSKPGAWALDSEENEEELQRSRAVPDPPAALQAEFPSLSIAATTKTKKKKAQTLSLAEFTYSKPAEQQRAVEVDLLSLPTGPRQRTAEELDRTRLGGGFRSYGMGNHRDEEGRRERGGGGFGRDATRESAPSRADEIDNWASGKKAPLSRDRGERGGFFDNHSRADESDSWVSMKKSFPAPTEGGRRFGGGFGSGAGADSDSWGRKKEDSQTEGRRYSGGGFDRDRFGSGGADSEKWGRNKEARTVEVVETENAGGRPRLNLKPRTLPVVSAVQVEKAVVSAVQVEKAGKTSNPFGEARPREEVLAEKGQDWKKIDEQLENNKIKEMDAGLGRKKTFGPGNGKVEVKSEHSWRKHVAFSANNEYIDDARPESSEKAESEISTEEN